MIQKYKISEIDAEKQYTITDIVTKGWVLNSKGNRDRMYVWKLVQNGILKAHNLSTPNRLLIYTVRGEDLIKFLRDK